jgi:unsaturated rhamnogalacturonyl hydrolase
MTWSFRLWGFGEAIALRGLLAFADAADEAAAAFVHGLLRAWLRRSAACSPADHVAPGCELLAFWRRTDDPVFLEAARALAALHASFPQHESGARWHRSDQPGWQHQIWVDSVRRIST